MGERTLYGVAKEGWFIPYRYAPGVNERRGFPLLERKLEADSGRFIEFLESLASYREDLLAIGVSDPAPSPRWDQDWFAGLDAATAYAMVRTYQPRCIIEVGSGHSTRFMMRALQDGAIECDLIAIDPQPRADISKIGVRVINEQVEKLDPEVFEHLHENDILFIDSSHILMPGTDVDFLFGEVIPALRPGVLVHIHDIFLPAPYPPEWELRGYNEQNALAPLIAGGVLSPLFPCHYVRSALSEEVAAHTGFIPRPRPNHDASFWTVKV